MIEAETAESVSLSIPRHFGNYTAHKVIGQGSTCVVLEATDLLSRKDYAVKVMSCSVLKAANLATKVEQEICILRSLTHENVVAFHDLVRQGDLLFIVTEKCVGGDVLRWIMEGLTGDKQTLKRLFHDVSVGLEYLHRQGIAHNDIKPENTLIDGFGRAKLCDFGYAKTQTCAGENEKSGTLMYAAPEFFRPGTYDAQKADLWSLGILLYVMATGQFPFNGANNRSVVSQICEGDLKYAGGLDCEVEQLIRRLTKVNPNERPTIDSLLDDPFFDDVRPVSTKKGAAGR
jgi:serine/threonine protein kinase